MDNSEVVLAHWNNGETDSLDRPWSPACTHVTMSESEQDLANKAHTGSLHTNEILDGMDLEWSPACSRMGDNPPRNQGDDFLDGLPHMEGLLEFSSECNITLCLHA